MMETFNIELTRTELLLVHKAVSAHAKRSVRSATSAARKGDDYHRRRHEAEAFELAPIQAQLGLLLKDSR